MQPRWLDGQWVAATAVDGYWGDEFTLEVAHDPWGPWTTVAATGCSPRGFDPLMNTYHAHLVPWRGPGGRTDRDGLEQRSRHAPRRLVDARPLPTDAPSRRHGSRSRPPPPTTTTTTTTDDHHHDDDDRDHHDHDAADDDRPRSVPTSTTTSIDTTTRRPPTSSAADRRRIDHAGHRRTALEVGAPSGARSAAVRRIGAL